MQATNFRICFAFRQQQWARKTKKVVNHAEKENSNFLSLSLSLYPSPMLIFMKISLKIQQRARGEGGYAWSKWREIHSNKADRKIKERCLLLIMMVMTQNLRHLYPSTIPSFFGFSLNFHSFNRLRDSIDM